MCLLSVVCSASPLAVNAADKSCSFGESNQTEFDRIEDKMHIFKFSFSSHLQVECQQMAEEYCGSVYHQMLVANHADFIPSQLLPKRHKAKRLSATNPTAHVEPQRSTKDGDSDSIPNHDSKGGNASSVRVVKSRRKSRLHILGKPDRRTLNELGGLGDQGSENDVQSTKGGFVGGWIRPKKDDGRDGHAP